MDNADVFGSSTAPLSWHDFLERMRQPSASDFVKAIKSFIVSFMNNSPDPERDSAAVQEFFNNMEVAFRAHSLWANCSEEELESAGEGLEKYVMTKLYPRVFATLPEDVKVDTQLHEKMALIQQFIRPENLDIKPTFQNETSWLLAQKEIQKINMYKAPRDKLVCILNCCKVINNLLLNASIAANENPPGADEFLPVLIYVTLKANPPQLHSNLLYIQRYRRQSRLVAEAAYFFTNMLSVESFILSIDANSLSMDETEYENNIASARALLSGLSMDSDDIPSQSNQNISQASRTESTGRQVLDSKKHRSPTTQPQLSIESSDKAKSVSEETLTEDQLSMDKVPSISDLENKGATILSKDEQVSKIFREFPYLYAQAGDLTVSDVEILLNNYKQLVFKYVCLSTGLGIATSSHPQSISQSQPQHYDKTIAEPNDTRATEMNRGTQEDASGTVDDPNGVSLVGVENSESTLPQVESVASEDEVKDEIPQR